MEAGLSRGVVAAILASEDGWRELEQPAVLQVADLQPLGSTTRRFRMVLSDGVQSVQGMLPTSMNHLVGDGELCQGTVLRLLEYMGSTLKNRRIFMFVQFEILQTDCMMVEYSEGQRIEADHVRKTIAQINSETNLIFSDDTKQSVVVKAILTFINKEKTCYPACPLVVDGTQCCKEVSMNEDGWWHCHSCNHTFAACDYMYRIFIQIQDPTGSTYACATQQAGQDIFGCTAKELYSMRYEQQDSAQFDKTVDGVLFRDFLFELTTLQSGAVGGKAFPKWIILCAEEVNPSTESRLVLREINKLIKESSDSTAAYGSFVGSSRMGFSFSYLQDSWRLQNFSHGRCALSHGGSWDLVSQTGSNGI